MNTQIRRTILVVEANSDNREKYRQYLLGDRKHNYKILEANRMDEGLSLWHQHQPEAVLLDAHLADVDISAFVNALKNQASSHKAVLPVVMMIEAGDEAIALQAIKAGAQDYLIREHITPERLQLTVIRTIEAAAMPAADNSAPDIAEYKRAAEALQDSESRFRQLTENIDAVFWIREEPEGRVSYVSSAYERLWGWSPQELYKRRLTWVDHIHLEDRERTQLAFDAKAATGEFDEEYRIVLDDGSIRWVRDRCFPLKDSAGKIYRFTGITEDITEQVITKLNLQRSEEFKNRVLDSSGDCIKILDLDSRILYMNAAGMSRMEIDDLAAYLGIHWVASWREEYRQAAAAAFAAAKSGEVGKFRGFYPTMTGKPKWWDVVLTPIRDSAKQITQILAISRDVSDRKQAQADLHEQTKLLQVIVSSIGDGLVSADLQGNLTLFNKAAQKIFGPLSTSDSHQNWSKTYGLFLPDQQTLFPNEQLPLARAMKGESVTEEVFVRRWPNNPGRWIRISGYPLVDENQDVNGGIIVCADITERKRTEAELRQKNAILDVINDSAPTPIFVKDRQGRIIYANPATLAALGKTADEVLGRYDSDVYPSMEDAVQVMENDQRIMASGQVETVEESPDGVRTFLGTKVPYRDQAGEVIGLIGIANDITERVQIERDRERILQEKQTALAESERVNRIKDEFLAVLSHELRSPLNPILGWAKLLQKRKFDEAKTLAGLEAIERNAKTQCQLIDDLLDMARVLRGKLPLNAVPVDLSTVITAAMDTVKTAAIAKSIQIHPALSDIGQISGDAVRLQQIVWNLLTNAVKFTPNGGRIDIVLQQSDQMAQITITDTGKGIRTDFLPHIFESFCQEDSSVTRHYGGLGLGMTIVYQLVEAHGGTIVAQSAGENKGATFTLRFPLLNNNVPQQHVSQQAEPPQDLSGIRVLTIDDEPDSLELLSAVLAQAGAESLSVASATDFFTALSSFQPDVVISDIGMPTVDGYMLMRQMRSRSPEQGGQTLAIALTAYAGELDRQQAIAAGFQTHIAKPIEPDHLVQAIASLLKGS